MSPAFFPPVRPDQGKSADGRHTGKDGGRHVRPPLALRAGTALGGFLFVAGVASLVWQFQNQGATLPFPGLQGLNPGTVLYGAAGAAGLGLAMAVLGWRAALKERQNEDFWNSATRVDPDMAGYREEDDARLEAQAGPDWRWLLPFMIAGFITGAVFYLEQTWYYTDSPYRFMAIAFTAVMLLAWGAVWAVWRGIRAVISRRRKKGRRWDAAVRGGGRSMRAVRKAPPPEVEPEAAVEEKPAAEPAMEPDADAGAQALEGPAAEALVASPGAVVSGDAGPGSGGEADLNWDDLGAPEPRRLVEAIEAVLDHERVYKESAAAVAEQPEDGGSKPKTPRTRGRRRKRTG